MRIINNGEVRMAHLCIRGSHSVNGVAKLHTEILKHEELKDFYNDEPYKFNNKTNGIAHRRWLISSNTELSDLITGLISEDWKTDTRKLKELEAHRHDKAVLEKIGQIKYNNKERLAKFIKESKIEDMTKNRDLIIPGKAAVLKGDIEDNLPGWNVIIGTEESMEIPKFLKEYKAKQDEAVANA